MTARSIRLTVDIASSYKPGHVHRVGTAGFIVEALGPHAYLVEVTVPDASLEGDAWYETIEIRDTEFELTHPVHRDRKDIADWIRATGRVWVQGVYDPLCALANQIEEGDHELWVAARDSGGLAVSPSPSFDPGALDSPGGRC